MKKISQDLLLEIQNTIFQLKPEDYALNINLLKGNSIGKHVRHILDLFECLIHSSENGILSYDSRKRCPETESDKEFVLEKIQIIIDKLDNLNLNQKIILQQNLSNSICEINSTIERELLYNIEHCVHHLAIIRIGIDNNFDYVKLPENFGVAYSTISHREQKVG